MKVTIEITGSDRDYMVKANTSQPLNDETRLVLKEAVSSLVGTTSEMDETADKLVHMKDKREYMKRRNKSARECLEDLSNEIPVWVEKAYSGGGRATIGAADIAADKAKEKALLETARLERESSIPF